MTDVPGWVTLASAVVAGGTGFGASAWSQWRAERAQVDRQREHWKHDEQSRTFERREQAYIEFVTAWEQAYRILKEHQFGRGDLDEGGRLAEARRVVAMVPKVRFYGPDRLGASAEGSVLFLLQFARTLSQEDCMKAAAEFRTTRGLIREDLGLRRDLPVS